MRLVTSSGWTAPIAVRPEKVRILAAATAADPDDVVIGGVVRDVQYHGGGTRYRVVLDAGPEFVVESQNLTVADTPDVSRGRKVELAFRRGHVFRVPEPVTTRRRGHMKAHRAKVLAVGLALLLVAAACGGDDDDDSASNTTGPPASIGKGEGAVSILAWPGYAEDGSTSARTPTG